MKILAKVFSQSVAVGHYPGFHTGGHEEDLIVMSTRWPLPPVTLSEMIPRPIYVAYRFLTVDQQCDVF